MSLRVEAGAFFAPAARPARCQLTLTAVGPGVDPTPADNVTVVTLEVVDDHD